MAPRKAAASSSSSKAPRRSTAAKKVNPAKPNEPSAAGNKRKAAAPPPRPATPPPALITVYVLMKSEGYPPDGFHRYQPPTNSIEGVYYSEDQAYAAAIPKIISAYEEYHDEQAELRNIATTEGLSLKERMERITAAAPDLYGVEVTSFSVYKSELFPTENVDEGRLLEGLKPMQSDSDYSRDGAASSSSDDGEPSSDDGEPRFGILV